MHANLPLQFKEMRLISRRPSERHSVTNTVGSTTIDLDGLEMQTWMEDDILASMTVFNLAIQHFHPPLHSSFSRQHTLCWAKQQRFFHRHHSLPIHYAKHTSKRNAPRYILTTAVNPFDETRIINTVRVRIFVPVDYEDDTMPLASLDSPQLSELFAFHECYISTYSPPQQNKFMICVVRDSRRSICQSSS